MNSKEIIRFFTYLKGFTNLQNGTWSKKTMN